MNKIELYNDNYANYKSYQIPKAQLIIADIPYQIGVNAYGSNPMWYNGGDNTNGESEYAKKSFFRTDEIFKVPEFMFFCSRMLKPEPKKRNEAPCMIVFCAFEQQFELIEEAKKNGLNNYINLVFKKNYSPQVLKANMRVVGNSEYGLIFYRDKLPKFRNYGNMVFNCMNWTNDPFTPKVHPTQKPVPLLEYLIRVFTDAGDVVIDPCAGSGTTLLAAKNLNRSAYGFEVDKNYFRLAQEKILSCSNPDLFECIV